MTHILAAIDPAPSRWRPIRPPTGRPSGLRGLLESAPEAEALVGGCVAGYGGRTHRRGDGGGHGPVGRDEPAAGQSAPTEEIALGGAGRMLTCAAAAGRRSRARTSSTAPARWTAPSTGCGRRTGGSGATCWAKSRPAAFCGSGLVDAVAALIELDGIDESGRMTGRRFELLDGVAPHPGDVREVQLAQGRHRRGHRHPDEGDGRDREGHR
jgi:hypothetical protein